MTRKDLDNALEKIGWKCLHSHKQMNDWFVNHKGEGLPIHCRSDRLEVRSNELFGKKASEYGSAGSIVFYFKDCVVDVDEDNGAVNIVGKNDESIFMSFYNFK